MFVSLIIISLITFGGLSLTYLFAENETFLWRLAAGNIVGSAVFGTICFIFACFFGLNAPTILISLFISLSPLILLRKRDIRRKFSRNWQSAKGKLQNTNSKKVLGFVYYTIFFIIFWQFFERAMIETAEGIFTGASNNLGDLPYHLGAIFSFVDGQNFPPQNPSYADAKFTYPFIADLIASVPAALGARVQDAMFVQNMFAAFSLLVVLEKFTANLTNSKLAGRIAPILLFFSGGLGFLWFLNDYWQGADGFFEFLWNLPRDYTIDDNFRWGNSLVVLFITQRSLLLGMPLTIIILNKLWEILASEKNENSETNKKPFSIFHFPFSIFFTGLLAGTLPLIHAHSLFVLFVVTAFLFFFRLEKLREWIWFGVGAAIVAVPELIWLMTGSATETRGFFGWNFGWDSRGTNIFWFWLINVGLFIPLLLMSLIFWFVHGKYKEKEIREKPKNSKKPLTPDVPNSTLLLFYIPFALFFIIGNLFRLAPWDWDNIKVLIYWFVGSIPFVAWLLARLWSKDKISKVIAAFCIIVLISAGALDVWRTASEQINYKVFDIDAVKLAEQIKKKTTPDALFLNAPTYNSAIVLSGRRSLMRYGGHLVSHGINYYEREDDLRKIYAGDATADILLKKYDIEYILISPEEKAYANTQDNLFTLNEAFFNKFPVVAEAGDYKIFQVKTEGRR
ncbi:MAG: hypothetical protein ACR2MD_19495 [Aridibacter sp.]